MPSGCEELVPTGRDPHFWCQGQNPDSVFSTICVWGEAQWQDDIMLNRADRTPSPFSAVSERKSYLIKWVVTCPDLLTLKHFVSLGKSFCSVLK